MRYFGKKVVRWMVPVVRCFFILLPKSVMNTNGSKMKPGSKMISLLGRVKDDIFSIYTYYVTTYSRKTI
jgi:hypothetical protein